MGENDDAMHYDQDAIFKHLYVSSHLSFAAAVSTFIRCFYLDSPSNARRHGMAVKSKHENDINHK